MKTTKQDIKGSYKTADGKAQIDFGITYRNGYAEFTASGFYDGSSGQCIDEIEAAYKKDRNIYQIATWHALHHLKQVGGDTINAVSNMAAMYPAVSFHDNQAEQFLTSNGIKFRATLSDTKTPARSDNGKHGHHYRVTLSGDRYAKPRPVKRLVFDFWSSIKDAEDGIKTISPYSVLACISGDAYTPETFADFCGEYGYEEDSIKALQTFRRCSAFAKRLRAFFTAAELEQLQEIK